MASALGISPALARAFLEQIQAETSKEQKNSKDAAYWSVRVGFYSAFMVADKINFIRRKAGDEKVQHWSSDGKVAFSLDKGSGLKPAPMTMLPKREKDFLDETYWLSGA